MPSSPSVGDRPRALPARAGAALVACALAGALGALPAAAGAPDPVACLGWLALLAPAAGCTLGALCVPFFGRASAVPGVWALVLVLVDLAAERDLPQPLWGLCAVVGLFGLGFAAGACAGRAPITLAGLVLLICLGLAGLAPEGGLALESQPLGAHRPDLVRALFELSPVTLAYDCAGWDWAHANPVVYRSAGVEWFHRRPHDGALAGPVALVVGCVVAALGAALARRARRDLRRASPPD
jgi:hypothetical protein